MKKNKFCSYYDDPEFDYRDYWIGREYEHLAEKQILTFIYQNIGRQDSLVDIGGGYGRLVEVYREWVNSAVLVEPADKNLKEAKMLAKEWPNLKFKKGTAEQLPLSSDSVNIAQMIRVAHHCTDLKMTFKESYRVLKKHGWFILEFPNKIHGLMTWRNWLKGNWKYRSNLSSIDRRDISSGKSEVIPFMNHHPEQVVQWLEEVGFEICDSYSVSNLRRVKFLSLEWMLKMDKLMWGLSGPIWWGPSIFVLARK